MFYHKSVTTISMFTLVLAMTSGSVLGQVPSILDSADFPWKYEMDVDPTDQASIDLDENDYADWSYNNSTPATFDAGIATLSSTSLLMTGADTTDLWPTAGFTGTEGFTYEIKLKTVGVDPGTVSSFIACMSDRDDYGMFTVTHTATSWQGGASIGSDNSTDFHTFRVARNADADGGEWWLWRDGELITEGGAGKVGDLPDLDRFYFGTGISGSYTGSLEVDYVRLTEGAYQPIIPTYNPPTTIKNAADFDLVYDMTVDPTDPTAIDLDDDDVADWVTSTGTPVSIDIPGILTVQTDATLRSGTEGAGIWPSQQFTAADGFTFDISMQVEELPEQAEQFVNTLVFALSDSDETMAFFVGSDSIRMGTNVILTDIDNSDAQHEFRIARDSDADGGRWWFWRDGELVGDNGYPVSNIIPDLDATYFGPAVSSASAGTVYVDSVSITDGAFAPESTTLTPGDANKDGYVDVTDLGILATNYGASGVFEWGDGDFTGDGAVNVSDLGILATWYGTEPDAQAVPEPSTFVGLLGLCLAGVMASARRRRG